MINKYFTRCLTSLGIWKTRIKDRCHFAYSQIKSFLTPSIEENEEEPFFSYSAGSLGSKLYQLFGQQSGNHP